MAKSIFIDVFEEKVSHLCPSLGLLFIPLQPPPRPRRISVGVELDMHDVRAAGTGGR